AFLHKHDVSVKDQRALDEVRKKQLGEEIDNIRKLEQSRSKENEHVGVVDQTHMNNIARLANSLQVFTTPNENTDDALMETMDTMQNYLRTHLNDAGTVNNIETLRLGTRATRSKLKFETGQTERRVTIAERRRKGKEKALTVDTNLPVDMGYDWETFTHPQKDYVLPYGSARDVGIFDDRNVASLQPFIDRSDKYPPGFGETARRLNILQASSPLASHGTRKANVVYGQRKRSKSKPDPRLNPIVSDVALELAREIEEEQAKPIDILPPISQSKAQFSTKVDKMVGRNKGGKFTGTMKSTIVNAFLANYAGAVSPTSLETLKRATSKKKVYDTMYSVVNKNKMIPSRFNADYKKMPKRVQSVVEESDNESIASETDDLIKSLVEKYAGTKREDTPETAETLSIPMEGKPDDSIEKPKQKHKVTEKQLEHLKKTREIAVEKMREYAAKRGEEKEQAEREEYEKRIDQIADKKLKDKLLKALEEQANFETKKKSVKVQRPRNDDEIPEVKPKKKVPARRRSPTPAAARRSTPVPTRKKKPVQEAPKTTRTRRAAVRPSSPSPPPRTTWGGHSGIPAGIGRSAPGMWDDHNF
ncbi:hypothetical protein HDV00_012844, partial [Rhizophlyctis rosea]